MKPQLFLTALIRTALHSFIGNNSVYSDSCKTNKKHVVPKLWVDWPVFNQKLMIGTTVLVPIDLKVFLREAIE